MMAFNMLYITGTKMLHEYKGDKDFQCGVEVLIEIIAKNRSELEIEIQSIIGIKHIPDIP